MFIGGDDDNAKSVPAGLVDKLGFETVDVSELALARPLEPYAALWIHVALRRGFGPTFGFGLLRRQP